MFDSRRLCTVLAITFAFAMSGAAQRPDPDPLDGIRKLLRAGRYVEAESGARALLAGIEIANGADSVQASQVMDVLVEALWRGGKVRAPETRALAERSVAIREKQLGPRHPDLGFSLTTLGIVLRLRGDYPGARALFERALAIQEQALGPGHPDVARTLTMSAGLAVDTGDLAGGETLNQRARAIRQQALGDSDPTIAENLNGLGVIQERRGDYAGAEKYHQQALSIRESALGPEHPDVASTLNNLGNVRNGLGDYAASRSLHERALAIRDKALGADHPDVAMSLNNLAISVRDLGDHAAAWWLMERVFAIYLKVFGPAHPNVAFAYQNLGSVLADLGEKAGTSLLAERARRFKRAGTEGRHISESLNPLVGIDPPLSARAAARSLFERALAIKEEAYGPNHPSVAFTLTSLASVHSRMGRPSSATPLYQRALAIREKALGPAHPDVADTLDRLGESLAEAGDYAGAKPIYERVLAMTDQVHGSDHPHAGVIRQHLAEVLARLGDESGALRMALDAERIGREHLRLIGRTLPEREALMYAAMRPAGLDVALSLLGHVEARKEVPTSLVWDAVVRSRAVVLDEMASRHRRLSAADAPDITSLVKELAQKREQLARLVVRGPAGQGPQYRLDLERARAARDESERALAERSLQFRQEQIQHRFGFDDARAALPAQSALIAFVRYQEHPFGARGTGARAEPVAAYLAFVLRAGHAGVPAVVPLGPASDLDREIARWREQVMAVALAGGRSTARAEAAVRRSGSLLRAKIWDPLASEVAGAKLVFIVPDGQLHLVNWEALPADGGAYLIERAPLFHYLSAERDLVPRDPVGGRGLVVVDSPVFSDRVAATRGVEDRVTTRPASAGASAGIAAFRGANPDCGNLDWMRFDPLPASAREAATIERIWRRAHVEDSSDPAASVLRLSGRGATEAALKDRAAGARVLHLATHGFFLGTRCASPAGSSAIGAADEPDARARFAGNPLLLAGFALTGANRRAAAGPQVEDGILTAEEIAALDLRSVEWAVLSGCDTGVGEVLPGEGVFGLRRAFQLAGARTVIMSLWPVDDEDTRRWMTGVYERRFAAGAATTEAVRESTLEQLRRRRRTGSSTHPFYWAAFIAAGDWR